MTQKELSYLEDAVKHEESIISICTESIKNLNDEKLVSFFEDEIPVHTEMRDRLLSLLEVKASE